MKRLTTALAFILSVSMLTACGSSDSSDSSQTEEASSAAQPAESTSESTEESSEAAPTYKSIKLMLFGDSITDGFWLEGGYRTFLCDKLEENGLSQYVDFVGKKQSGGGYDNQHEGYTGYSIERITESITGARTGLKNVAKRRLEENKPDVVTLMVGTNDILSHYELDKAGERLEGLVDEIFEYLPDDGMLFLATIPDMDANDTTYIDAATYTVEYMDQCVEDYNKQVTALVEKKKGEGKNIELCDVHSVLTKEDLYDGVHPSEAGYIKLADYWYDVISKYIAQ